jgi:hypothetical protein
MQRRATCAAFAFLLALRAPSHGRGPRVAKMSQYRGKRRRSLCFARMRVAISSQRDGYLAKTNRKNFEHRTIYDSAARGTLKFRMARYAPVNARAVILRARDEIFSPRCEVENRADSERCGRWRTTLVIRNACAIAVSATVRSSKALRRHRSYVSWKTPVATPRSSFTSVNSHSSADEENNFCRKLGEYVLHRGDKHPRKISRDGARSIGSLCQMWGQIS